MSRVSASLSQRVPERQARKRHKACVVRPQLGGSIFKRDECDLHVENPGTLDSQVRCNPGQPFPETVPRHPDDGASPVHETGEEIARLPGSGRTAGAGRMGHDTPEFGQAWRRDAPALGGPARRFQGAPGSAVLRHSCPVGVNQQIGVKSDQACRASQSCMRSRSATSNPGGRPPRATVHRMRRLCRNGFRRACSSRRSPRASSSRRVTRSSAALFLAAISSSSGRSTVVFIRLPIIP